VPQLIAAQLNKQPSASVPENPVAQFLASTLLMNLV